jgi:hypothetical protein
VLIRRLSPFLRDSRHRLCCQAQQVKAGFRSFPA